MQKGQAEKETERLPWPVGLHQFCNAAPSHMWDTDPTHRKGPQCPLAEVQNHQMPDPFSPSAQPQSAAQAFRAPTVQQLCITPSHNASKLPLAPLRCSVLRLAKSHCLPQGDSEQESHTCHQEKPRERRSGGGGNLPPAPMYPTRETSVL